MDVEKYYRLLGWDKKIGHHSNDTLITVSARHHKPHIHILSIPIVLYGIMYILNHIFLYVTF